jgi:hypothetical protein
MAKIEREQCLVVDLAHLRRKHGLHCFATGQLSWSNGSKINYELDTISKDKYIRLSYIGDDGRIIYDRFRIIVKKPNYGGQRYLIVCNKCSPINSSGGTEIMKLYLPPGGTHFACRHCYRLTYHLRNYKYGYDWLAANDYAKKISRWYYNGKPTRKHKRYSQIEQGIAKGMQ